MKKTKSMYWKRRVGENVLFYIGQYEFNKKGEREFHLILIAGTKPGKGKRRTVKFKSWQAAVKKGWWR